MKKPTVQIQMYLDLPPHPPSPSCFVCPVHTELCVWADRPDGSGGSCARNCPFLIPCPKVVSNKTGPMRFRVRVHSGLVHATSVRRRISLCSRTAFWSVCPFGSMACVKKLRNVQLFRQRRIRRPIRWRLCKYIPRVYWIHFAIRSRKNLGVVEEMWNDRIVFSLLFVSFSCIYIHTSAL